MNCFRMNRPRGFHHDFIYYDEKKAQLKALEDKARRELGLDTDRDFCPEELRGAFVRATSHLRKRKQAESEGRHHISLVKLLFFILALVILWSMLAI